MMRGAMERVNRYPGRRITRLVNPKPRHRLDGAGTSLARAGRTGPPRFDALGLA